MSKLITLEDITDSIKLDRQKKKYDTKIAITGWLGKGKSTLGYQIGKRIDDDFGIERNYIFEAAFDAIRSRVFALKGSAIIIDEAIDVLYKMDWADDLQNALVKLLTKIRGQRNTMILCIPQFTELRRSFRNYAIDYWIHIPRRGVAVVFGKSQSAFEEDPWHIKENNRAFWDATKRMTYLELAADIDKQVALYSKTPGCIGYFLFDRMPDGDQETFDTLSEAAKERTSEKTKLLRAGIRYKKAIQRLGLAIGLLNKKYRMTQEDIGDALHMKQAVVSQYMHGVVSLEQEDEEVDMNAAAEPVKV